MGLGKKLVGKKLEKNLALTLNVKNPLAGPAQQCAKGVFEGETKTSLKGKAKNI